MEHGGVVNEYICKHVQVAVSLSTTHTFKDTWTVLYTLAAGVSEYHGGDLYQNMCNMGEH